MIGSTTVPPTLPPLRGNFVLLRADGLQLLLPQQEVGAAQYLDARPRESSLPDPSLSLGWASNGGPWPGAGLGVNATSNLASVLLFIAAGRESLSAANREQLYVSVSRGRESVHPARRW